MMKKFILTLLSVILIAGAANATGRKKAIDPDNLPKGDLKTMNFGSGGNTKAKAWKDIWGSGQGIGNVHAVRSAADFIAQLRAEYSEAYAALQGKYIA